MLVLTRKDGETLVITVGEQEVVIHVLNTRGNKIKVGVEAEPDVRVRRGELSPR